MQGHTEALVAVQREWDGWRTAHVRMRHLENVHWFQPLRAHRPLIHAHVRCTDVVAGHIPHDCDLTPPPHRLLVCVLKTHTAPDVYAELARRADDPRLQVPAQAVPDSSAGANRAR